MKVTIELDTELPAYCAQISVDGKRLGRVQELDMHIDMEGGNIRLSRLMLGYGGRFLNRLDYNLVSEGGPWKQI